MSRLSVITALVAAGLLVVVSMSILLTARGDSPVTNPVAASTPDSSKCKPCIKPDGTESGSGKPNAVPNVTDLALDKTEVRLPCSGAESTSAQETFAEVTTTAEDADGDVLTYNYVISGGRIIGTGKKVNWHLTKVQPGTYTITAGVDDGCGICGKTETKTVTVQECGSTE